MAFPLTWYSNKEFEMARKSKTRTHRASTRHQVTRRTRRATNGGNVWSAQELSFLRKYYRNNETSWVARQLGRTVYSVRYKASDMGIKKSRPSMWRGNQGETQGRKATGRRQTRKQAWSAKSRRTTRTRHATPRRRPARRPHSRRRH